MNHALRILADGTLVIKLPKGKDVSKVLVEWDDSQNGKLFIPDTLPCTGCVNHLEYSCKTCARRYVDKYQGVEE